MTDTMQQEIRGWIGRDLVEEDGSKIGRIDDIYVDEATREPEWVAVTTGLFGNRMSFVPLRDLSSDGESLISPWEKDRVKDAPNADADGHLSPEEESALYRHYGMDNGAAMTGRGDADQRDRDRGQARAGTADDAMTRSEEELDVHTTEREAGRARLRKWVETDTETVTVPVRKEKVAVVREPITDANRDDALRGPDISEGEHEITLSEEEVVVDKRTVPKERVRLDKDVEVEERQVSADVRSEHVEVEDGTGTTPRRS